MVPRQELCRRQPVRTFQALRGFSIGSECTPRASAVESPSAARQYEGPTRRRDEPQNGKRWKHQLAAGSGTIRRTRAPR